MYGNPQGYVSEWHWSALGVDLPWPDTLYTMNGKDCHETDDEYCQMLMIKSVSLSTYNCPWINPT